MYRTTCALLLSLGVTCLLGAEDKPSGYSLQLRQPDPPNIILVVASQLSASDLSCYGSTNVATPAIDRLASEGIRFTQCYAGSALTGPSQTTLLTGLHTGHLKARSATPLPLEPEAATLAEFLKSAGFKTGGIGRWALGSILSPGAPHRQGYNDWVGFLDPAQFHSYYPAAFWRIDGLREKEIKTTDQFAGAYIPDFFAFVRSNYVRVNKYVPFFLHYSVNLPGPDRVEASTRPIPSRKTRLEKLDREIGALVQQVQNLDLDMSTAILLTSDHPSLTGTDPDFPELTPDNLHIPLIVRWPGKVKPRRVSEVLCASWDVFPTISHMVQTNIPPNLDGISLVPTLLGQKQTNQHDTLYWTVEKGGEVRQAVRAGQWHSAGSQMIHVPQKEPGDETRLLIQEALKKNRPAPAPEEPKTETP